MPIKRQTLSLAIFAVFVLITTVSDEQLSGID